MPWSWLRVALTVSLLEGFPKSRDPLHCSSQRVNHDDDDDDDDAKATGGGSRRGAQGSKDGDDDDEE